jgi:hypothetical protein
MDIEFKNSFEETMDFSKHREPTIEEAIALHKHLAEHVLSQGPMTRIIVYGLRSVATDVDGQLDADIFVAKFNDGKRDGEIVDQFTRDMIRHSVWRGRPYYLLAYWPSADPDRPIDGAVLGQASGVEHFMFPNSWQKLVEINKDEDWGFFRQDFSEWPLPGEETQKGLGSLSVKEAMGTFFGATPNDTDGPTRGNIDCAPDSVGGALLQIEQEQALTLSKNGHGLFFGVLHKDRTIFAERSGFMIAREAPPVNPNDPYPNGTVIGPPLSSLEVCMLQAEFYFVVHFGWFKLMGSHQALSEASNQLRNNPAFDTGDTPQLNGQNLSEGIVILVQKPGDRGRTPTETLGHIISTRRQDGSYEPWKAVRAVAMHPLLDPIRSVDGEIEA